VAALCLVSASGAAAPAATIRVEKAWARPGLAAYMSAAYMVITNEGRTADRLVAAETGVAWTVEIHQTIVEGGMARMQKVSGIEIPPGATIELKPGGYHIMLIGLRRNLEEGEKFPIVLVFKEAGRIRVTAEVRMSGP
jgi:copper(I)-binding protein